MTSTSLDHALHRATRAAVTDLASERDADIASTEASMVWICANNGLIQGSVIHEKSPNETAALVVRWATALGLTYQRPDGIFDTGLLIYAGAIGARRVIVKGMVDPAEYNRRQLELQKR